MTTGLQALGDDDLAAGVDGGPGVLEAPDLPSRRSPVVTGQLEPPGIGCSCTFTIASASTPTAVWRGGIEEWPPSPLATRSIDT